MPLSSQERQDLINQMKTQIGSFDGSSNVWFGGYGFSAPTRIYNWFRNLPAKYQLRILQYIGERQTEVVGGVVRGEEPYNFGGGTNRQLYIQQLLSADVSQLTSVNAVVKTAEAVFNPTEAKKWEREQGGGTFGLWNYAKSSRFNGNTYEDLHNWLKDLLPELYCDYVNEIEPKEEPVVRQIVSTPLVYYVSWGDVDKQSDRFVEILFYPSATPNAIDNLRNKFQSYTPAQRNSKLSALFSASNKKNTQQQYQQQSGSISFRYDLTTHSWVRRTDSINETVLLRYNAVNYLTQSDANGILT